MIDEGPRIYPSIMLHAFLHDIHLTDDQYSGDFLRLVIS